MNLHERKAVAGLIDCFSRLQSTQALRVSIADALQGMEIAEVTQVYDMFGHIEPLRGAEVLHGRHPEIMPGLQRDYASYLPQHPLWNKWSDVLRETTNSVAAMGERTDQTAWKKSGFLNDFCRKKDIVDVIGIHLLGPKKHVRFGIAFGLSKHDRFTETNRKFFTWLAPFLSRGMTNNLSWDALAAEGQAAQNGFNASRECLASIRNGKLLAASPQAERVLRLKEHTTSRNLPLAEFIQTAPHADPGKAPVRWTSGEGNNFKLLSARAADGTCVVRFFPEDSHHRAQLEWHRMSRSVGLTERQAAIVALVAEGLSDKQIAIRHGTSVHTIRAHLRSIYAALSVSGRLEALNAVRFRAGR